MVEKMLNWCRTDDEKSCTTWRLPIKKTRKSHAAPSLSSNDFSEQNKQEKKNRKQSFSDKKVFRDIADQIDVCKRKSETGLSLLAYWHLLPVNSHVVLDSTG